MRGGGIAGGLVVIVLAGALAQRPPDRAIAQTAQPNIVVIVTDDQALESMRVMPTVRKKIGNPGVVFNNGFVSNPLCCPSRATILTGALSHTTGVYSNEGTAGGFSAFDDSSTVATWLDAAGYDTAFVGKYLNEYQKEHASYRPPGWDRWATYLPNGNSQIFYDYDMIVDGRLVHYPKEEKFYATRVLTSYATSFIKEATGPFLMYYFPNAPHAPADPERKYRREFQAVKPLRGPSYDEKDVSDKPAYIQALPRMSDEFKKLTDRFRRDQLRTLLSVDDSVGRIIKTLKGQGHLQNTMIIFMSDNGYSYGHHRWRGKQVPYEESIRVPFYVRYDPLTDGGKDNHLVLNTDVAPTIADLAGVSVSGVDGLSLLPLLEGNGAEWRTDFLLEHLYDDNAKVPTYCGVRNKDYTYVNYETGEEELYDLVDDPRQLRNLAADPEYLPVVAQLRARMLQLCIPPPPGFVPVAP